jgi:two-component system, chemotaxis family, response regulator Rcp1
VRSEVVTIDILLVEDNKGDVRLLQELLLETNKSARLHVVRDGAEAMEFLGHQGRYVDAPRPQLILLDLNLPKMHGHDVLSRVKKIPHLQSIPIIVLTSSAAESDLVTSYQLRANCYLRKPAELKQFESLVKNLNDFWLVRIKSPAKGRAMGPV